MITLALYGVLLPWSALGTPVDRVVSVVGAPRAQPIDIVVLHSTGGPDCDPRFAFRTSALDSMVNYFANRNDGISIHYVIGRDGTVVSMVPETQVAHHVRGANNRSIGIEMINNGDGNDPYPEAQVRRATDLLEDILRRNSLPPDAISTHAALDTRYVECSQNSDESWTTTNNNEGRGQRRRIDPGPAFPLNAVRTAIQERLENTP
ncbi:MAG: N-acetylmuramoyl-L-alanine amidase [Proteobacteria bacterium]|nr:N-acetylmuramoyl-L-alanine amidase [Pseudomonadota bacterium]